MRLAGWLCLRETNLVRPTQVSSLLLKLYQTITKLNIKFHGCLFFIENFILKILAYNILRSFLS